MPDRAPHKAPDYRQRVAGPGAQSQRTDLAGNQPIRIPTGQPYGDAKRNEQLQQMTRLPQVETPEVAPAGGAPPSSAAGGAPGMVPPDPGAILGLLSGHPTDYPEQPMVGPDPTPQIGEEDELRRMIRLANRPGMPPQIRALGALYEAVDRLRSQANAQTPAPTFADLFDEDVMAEAGEDLTFDPMGEATADAAVV